MGPLHLLIDSTATKVDQRNVVQIGDPGTGKTNLAIARALIRLSRLPIARQSDA